MAEAPKPKKGDTYAVTLAMHREGKSIAEIAAARRDIRESELEQLRFQSDVLTGVAIVVSGNCCARCLADRGQWSFQNVPKLPHEDSAGRARPCCRQFDPVRA